MPVVVGGKGPGATPVTQVAIMIEGNPSLGIAGCPYRSGKRCNLTISKPFSANAILNYFEGL